MLESDYEKPRVINIVFGMFWHYDGTAHLKAAQYPLLTSKCHSSNAELAILQNFYGNFEINLNILSKRNNKTLEIFWFEKQNSRNENKNILNFNEFKM